MKFFPQLLNVFYSAKATDAFYRGMIIIIFFISCEQIAFADTIQVESDTQLLVHVDPLTQHGGRLSVMLLDDLNHPIGDVPIQISILASDGQIAKTDATLTNPSGQATFNLGLSPNQYTGKIEFSGYQYWHASSQKIEFEIVRCHAQTSISPSAPLFQPYSKPLSVQIHRAQCLQLEADYMVSIGSASTRVHLNEGQDSVQVQLSPILTGPETLLLEAALIEGNLFEPEILQQTVVFYDTISSSRPQLRHNWQNTWVEIQLHEFLSQFPLSLKIQDTLIEATSDDQGMARFILPEIHPGCTEINIYRTDRYREIGKISDKICLPEKSSNWKIVVLGLVMLLFSFSTVVVQKKLRQKPKLTAPDKIQPTSIKSIPLTSTKENTFSLVCKTSEAELPASEVKIEINGQIFHPTTWPFIAKESGNIQISHRACLTWHGTLKLGQQHTIFLTTRREYAISCFTLAAGNALHWGRETPDMLLKTLKSRYQDKSSQDKAERFCTLISEAAFDEKILSDDEIQELYQHALFFSSHSRLHRTKKTAQSS